jgi:hypothetical protein
MDATALVPFREPKDTLDRDDARSATSYMEIQAFIHRIIIPAEEERSNMVWSFQGVADYVTQKKQNKEETRELARRALSHAQDQDDSNDDSTEFKGKSLLERFAEWALKKVVKFVVKTAVKAVFRFARWILRDIIFKGIEGLVEWVARPVLMEVLEFVGMNPELWPVVLALGGGAALGYAAYDLFFKKSGSDSLGSATPDSVSGIGDDETKESIAAQKQEVNTETSRQTTHPTIVDQASARVARPARPANAPVEAFSPITAVTKSGSWTLGSSSQRYESGRGGAGTVSTGQGDAGGVSYGTYQFSSRSANGGPGGVQEFLKNSVYGPEFAGLAPGSPEFGAKWKELARDPAFGQAQHDFIKGQYYDVQMRRLKQAGFDLSSKGPAVQDDIWSTAVQLRGLTLTIVKGALGGQDWQHWTDAQIVSAIQDYKYDNTTTMFRSSPRSWDSLKSRARSEKATLVALANSTTSTADTQVALSKGVTAAAPTKTASSKSTNVASTGSNIVTPDNRNKPNTIVQGPQGVLIGVNT